MIAPTELDLAPIEARREKAGEAAMWACGCDACRQFGATARGDVDALIAEVKRQREEIQRLKTTSGE